MILQQGQLAAEGADVSAGADAELLHLPLQTLEALLQVVLVCRLGIGSRLMGHGSRPPQAPQLVPCDGLEVGQGLDDQIRAGINRIGKVKQLPEAFIRPELEQTLAARPEQGIAIVELTEVVGRAVAANPEVKSAGRGGGKFSLCLVSAERDWRASHQPGEQQQIRGPESTRGWRRGCGRRIGRGQEL